MNATEKLLSRIRNHCKGYNKFLTDEYLTSLSHQNLLGFCHPLERYDFAKELGIISSSTLKVSLDAFLPSKWATTK